MFFVALLYGTGEGCDYTIGCNISYRVFNEDSIEKAVEYCRYVWEEYGGVNGDPGIEAIDLYQIQGDRIAVPIDKWSKEGAKVNEVVKLEEELRNLDEQRMFLKKKLKEVKETKEKC